MDVANQTWPVSIYDTGKIDHGNNSKATARAIKTARTIPSRAKAAVNVEAWRRAHIKNQGTQK
jgi:hypothetical protein